MPRHNAALAKALFEDVPSALPPPEQPFKRPLEWSVWLAGLECPFTWECLPLDADSIAIKKDQLALCGSQFEGLLDRLLLAFSLSCQGRRAEARALVADGYALLLPPPAAPGPACRLVRDYRAALRHLLDATWAGLEAATALCLEPGLHAFVQRITPFQRLGPRQQAAVRVAQSVCAKDLKEAERLVREAIALAPKEAEWQYMLGTMLLLQRDEICCRKDGEGHEAETSALRAAHRMRPSALTAAVLARSLAHCGADDQRAESRRLAVRALRHQPDSPCVLMQVAKALRCLESLAAPGEQQGQQLDTIESLVERVLAALTAGGRRCAYVHFFYGLHLAGFDRVGSRARAEFSKAISVDAAAAGALCRARTKKTTTNKT